MSQKSKISIDSLVDMGIFLNKVRKTSWRAWKF